ncbi:phage tail tape measure protein [Tropicimonas sediminicola]|uniref:Phage tail tape measure protein, lambda family n=1 Tax=Tropicimonas sediminicola TaxID=1031541 RepID=A0A239EEV2_9RHOB|nr:phage tail tape measure protein [Tropicimonas sediminicola]SNS42808.1 phage tail tape measure protein, lambda family [Tropicimonas sediminicola]
MALDPDDVEALDTQIEALESTLNGAGSLVAVFGGELQKMQLNMANTSASVGTLSSSIGGGLRRAFDGLVFDGLKASDALQLVAQSIVNATYSAAIKPVTGQVSDMIASGIAGVGAAAFANGASFSQGRVMPFAKGGVVTSPTTFPMRGGTGLMGEAGPEAIMPLTRGADGKLGVKADGSSSRSVQVVMNISTPDAEGFRKSQTQIAAQVGRMLGRGQRNR